MADCLFNDAVQTELMDNCRKAISLSEGDRIEGSGRELFKVWFLPRYSRVGI